MKSLVTNQQVTNLTWQIPRRIIHADRPDLKAHQDIHIEAIIDAIHEPILILDKNLIIRSINKSFVKKFKISKKAIAGKPLVLNTKDNPQARKYIEQLTKLSRHNTSFEELELTYKFQTIGVRTFLINAKQIAYDNKQSDIILVSIEDITQRKLIEQQKDDFVGYVTHELKTPLTTLSAFTQLLQMHHTKTRDKKSQFLLAKTMGQVESLTNLLASFSQVYKAQTGMLKLHKETVDLYELVSETVEMFQYTSPTHTVTLSGNITKPIAVDKERIRQVLINLLMNAIKYSPESDTILVKFSEDAKHLIISVQDFGPGIPQAAQAQIFERFFRLKDKQHFNVKGLGLGLYIALEIVKAHKGKLWVESEEGQGATFSFSLPTK